jgi:hypothetical protein
MKKIILSFVILFILTHLQAQEEPDINNYKNEFGAHAGFTTGLGLSYRHWFDRIGLQLTAIPVKTDDFYLASMGLSGMYSLKKMKYVRVYLYVGNHFMVLDDYTYDYDRMGNYVETKTKESRYNIGFGPGFSFGKTVAYNIQFGYGLYDVTNKFNMYPTLEMGVYYMF